jgi:hypothetical protein
MTSPAQLEANRINAQLSTGPQTDAGKTRSSQNAVTHGFTGRLLVGLAFGPFADNAEDLQAFVDEMIVELAPGTTQEHAEALNIIGLYVRRGRLVELEAMAIAHATRSAMLPPEGPGLPPRIMQRDLTQAGANALSADLFERLPRYEGHLNRELDRSLARYAHLKQSRRSTCRKAFAT